ncbi:hypothetical protein DDI_3946 [Dickeya dianthicola RNS04.9]|nr:hypothetical protein DDI_3946 [Dickeya dianthicola RNS04.9]
MLHRCILRCGFAPEADSVRKITLAGLINSMNYNKYKIFTSHNNT